MFAQLARGSALLEGRNAVTETDLALVQVTGEKMWEGRITLIAAATPDLEVTNLANAIGQGDFSPALRRALADRERQIDEITTKLLEARPDSLRSKLRNISSFVVTRMQDLRAVLNSDVGHARAELAKHIDQLRSCRPAVTVLQQFAYFWRIPPQSGDFPAHR